MFRRVWRAGLAAGAMFTMLIAAQPAAAFHSTGSTGVTGAHSVADTSSNAGATCAYKSGPGQLSTLTHIYVNAPSVKAAAGHGTEKVGWSFTVQRKIQGHAWANRVTSKTYTASTDSSHSASFAQEGVKVIVPNGPSGPSAFYRVTIKMTWYAANGKSVIGTATGRIDYYYNYFTLDTTVVHGSCFDYALG